MNRVQFVGLAVGVMLFSCRPSQAASLFADPSGGWRYLYTGNSATGLARTVTTAMALDGRWTHTNTSDAWLGDGRGPGNGMPGGVESFNGVVTFEDASTNNPSGDENQKLYFTHELQNSGSFDDSILDNGITLYFRARLTPPGPKAEITLPDGYHIQSNGKGMFGVQQGNGGKRISFSLVRSQEDRSPATTLNFPSAGLTMNCRVGTVPGTSTVDSSTTAANNQVLPLDPKMWHEFWITIQPSGGTSNSTHVVQIWLDASSTPTTFYVTAGTGDDPVPGMTCLMLGLPASRAKGAFDLDFFGYKEGIHVPRRAGNRPFVWGFLCSQVEAPAALPPIVSILRQCTPANPSSALALHADGSLTGWGEILPPPTLSNALSIAAGDGHYLAVKNDGRVAAWGRGSEGQTNVPSTLSNVIAVAGGDFHSVALRSDGRVIAWGGLSPAVSNVPPSLSNVVAIAAGFRHNVALKTDGTVVVWGEPFAGLANLFGGESNFVAVSARGDNTLALRSNGTVAVQPISGIYPPFPEGTTNIVAIAAGTTHFLALRADGRVIAWGNDWGGEVNVPLRLNARLIDAGHNTSIAVGADHDDFETPKLIAGSSISIEDSNLGAGRQNGEPEHSPYGGGFDGAASLWYEWIAPARGGAIVTVVGFVPNSVLYLKGPMVAVYYGDSFGQLVPIVKNGTDFYRARAVFNALPGVTYKIAVDGTPLGGGDFGQGSFNLSIDLVPPPSNDLFSARTLIEGDAYSESGSLIGATRESNEPNHGDTNLQQTIWWTWTAPPGAPPPAASRLTLTADVSSTPPDLALYADDPLVNPGSRVNPISNITTGMSRVVSFPIVAGTTYNIALAGRHYDTDNNNVSDEFGKYHFRLKHDVLWLTVTNLAASSPDPQGPVNFSATCLVDNLGPVQSRPLRIRVVAVPGFSVKGDYAPPSLPDPLQLATTAGLIAPAYSRIMLNIAATCPEPFVGFNQETGYGWGVYALLEEQVGDNWFLLTDRLFMFGNWPALNNLNNGPGGGVIRLDPALGSSFNPIKLTNVYVRGTNLVLEGSTATFSGIAYYNNGVADSFTNTIWTNSHAGSSIKTNGMFKAGSVTSNAQTLITCFYDYAGSRSNATRLVTISNLPPPLLSTRFNRAAGTLDIDLSGVNGRRIAIDAATNLPAVPMQWTALATNTNGIWSFRDPMGFSLPRRFYRARELE